jgi:predicted HTH transcriptional regulator
MFDICEKCDGWGKLPGKTTSTLNKIRNADNATNSLDFTSIPNLIAQGESHTLEFKETLEYDIRQNQRVAGLAKASLKTIAAFLNADGGILLIGVSDSGEVKSITKDVQFVRGNNRDGFEQKLRSLINDNFDPSPLGNIEIIFEDLQEGTVCQINVERSSEPIAYDNDFYIRDGNGTRKLEGRDLADWLRQRNNN